MATVLQGRQNSVEYLLQGSVNNTSVEPLLHRLRGLCDNAAPDNQQQRFLDHEIIYILKNGTNNTNVSFRARHSLDNRDTQSPWQLRYIGTAEMGDKNRSTLVRSCIEVATSDNLKEFLDDLGFKFESEYVVKGFYFRKGSIRITVSQLNMVLNPGDFTSIRPISESFLVEMSLLASVHQDSLAEEMKNFAENLKPLVVLEKVDHRKLQLGT